MSKACPGLELFLTIFHSVTYFIIHQLLVFLQTLQNSGSSSSYIFLISLQNSFSQFFATHHEASVDNRYLLAPG